MMPPCADLDPFFDGELPRDAAAGFREHLAVCERCQAALWGRMQEEAVVEVAPERAARPDMMGGESSQVGPRRRRIVYLAPILVVAAVFVIWFLGTRGAQKATIQVSLAIEHHGDPVRGSVAHVGDVLRPMVRGAGHQAIWVYLDDRELVSACPGGAGCASAGGGLTVEVRLSAPGHYSVIAISSEQPIAAPHGTLDVMLNAVAGAGARFEMEHVDVN